MGDRMIRFVRMAERTCWLVVVAILVWTAAEIIAAFSGSILARIFAGAAVLATVLGFFTDEEGRNG